MQDLKLRIKWVLPLRNVSQSKVVVVINEDTPEVEYHDRAWVIAVTFFVALFVGYGKCMVLTCSQLIL